MKLNFIDGPKKGISQDYEGVIPYPRYFFPKPEPAAGQLILEPSETYDVYVYRCVAIGPDEAFYRFVE